MSESRGNSPCPTTPEAPIPETFAEAEAHAAEDKERRALVEARNHGEALIHSSEKSLADFGAKVSAADKSAIETAIEHLRQSAGRFDAGEIRSAPAASAPLPGLDVGETFSS